MEYYIGSTHSYITPKIVEICAFNKLKQSESWLVQLATGTKRKVSEIVEKYPLDMDGLFTYANLNSIRHGRLRGMISLTKGKVSNHFTPEIKKGSHRKL